ncbi:hypothetical protein GC173_12470 [bacterium]|nr:hypothetical protein [bacterium]
MLPASEEMLRLDYVLTSDAQSFADTPSLRLRLADADFQEVSAVSLRSLGGFSGLPYETNARRFSLYTVRRSDSIDAYANFDLLGTDGLGAAGVQVGLDTFAAAKSFAISDLAFQQTEFSQSSPALGAWTFNSDRLEVDIIWSGVESASTGGFSDGSLYVDLNGNTNHVGYWKTAGTGLTLDSERVYRARFVVGTDVDTRSTVPDFTIKVQSTDGSVSWQKTISSTGNGSASPMLGDSKGYDIWYRPPAELNGEGVSLVFVALGFNPSDSANARMLLEDVSIVSYAAPNEEFLPVATPTPTVTPTMTPVPTVTARSREKLIILAGGGDYAGNPIRNQTRQLAEYAHRVAVARGYAEQDIKYLSSFPTLPNSGGTAEVPNPNVDGPATEAALRQAITEWADGASSLFIMLLDHGDLDAGGEAYFLLDGSTSPRSILTTTALDAMLDTAQTGTDPLPEVILYLDMCYAGGFAPVVTSTPGTQVTRSMIASTSADRLASFGGVIGEMSFTSFYLSAAIQGLSLADSFAVARSAISTLRSPRNSPQSPQLDDDGDGTYTSRDGGRLRNRFVGGPSAFGFLPPEILSVTPDLTLYTPADTSVWVDTGAGGADQVQGFLVYEEQEFDPSQPISSYQTIDFVRTGTGNRWTASIPGRFLSAPGDYSIMYTASKRETSLSSTPVMAVPVARRIAIIPPTGWYPY